MSTAQLLEIVNELADSGRLDLADAVIEALDRTGHLPEVDAAPVTLPCSVCRTPTHHTKLQSGRCAHCTLF